MCSMEASGKVACVRRSSSRAAGDEPWESQRRLETSRGRSRCSTARASIIVGTTRVAVTRSCSTTSRTPPGVNAGTITWVPAAQIVARVPMVPAAWNIGATTMKRVSSVNGQHARKWKAFATRLPWVSITPLAAPVVPPV